MKPEIDGTTAGTNQTQKKRQALVLAIISTVFALLMSFLLLRWSGGTSAIERETNLLIKKSTKR